MTMNTLSDLMYMQPPPQEDESPFSDIRRRIVQEMMLAQNRVPAGMQRQIIENDPELFGVRQQSPAQPQGQSFKGQVGTTVMPTDKEAQLRAMLRARGLPADQIEAMVSQHKVQQGLR